LRLVVASCCGLALLISGCGSDGSDLGQAEQLCREALAERLDLAAGDPALRDLQQRSEGTDGSVILTGSVPLALARQGGADSNSDVISTVECRILDASSETPRVAEVAVGGRIAG
jgi:hypothetical protein